MYDTRVPSVCPVPSSLFFYCGAPKSVLGGFRAQGRTAVKAKQVVEDALAVQEAGAFAVVVECVPSPVAKAVTEALDIPTIGIGAGPCTSGQVGERLKLFVYFPLDESSHGFACVRACARARGCACESPFPGPTFHNFIKNERTHQRTATGLSMSERMMNHHRQGLILQRPSRHDQPFRQKIDGSNSARPPSPLPRYLSGWHNKNLSHLSGRWM